MDEDKPRRKLAGMASLGERVRGKGEVGLLSSKVPVLVRDQREGRQGQKRRKGVNTVARKMLSLLNCPVPFVPFPKPQAWPGKCWQP